MKKRDSFELVVEINEKEHDFLIIEMYDLSFEQNKNPIKNSHQNVNLWIFVHIKQNKQTKTQILRTKMNGMETKLL